MGGACKMGGRAYDKENGEVDVYIILHAESRRDQVDRKRDDVREGLPLQSGSAAISQAVIHFVSIR